MITSRHFGLDVIRAFAISLVLFSHINGITSHLPIQIPNIFNHINLPDGVDLFFVLSGFLIGRILLKTDWGSFSAIKNFWKRRFLRTLPNYFLFLIINIVLLYFSLAPGLLSHAILYYFVFMQNLYKPVDVFFWESWSLCVEEWFYVLFPIALFLLFKKVENKKMVFIYAIFLFFVFSFISKLYFINANYDLDLYIRKLAINRFDTLCIGLVIALIEVINTEFFKKIKWIGFIVFITYLCFGNKPLENNFIIVHFLFSALTCGGILIFCYSFSNANKLATLLIEFLSKISYSIYLVHLPVLYVLNYVVSKNYGGAPIFYFISYIFVVIALSFLNYTYFELYFLKRKK